MSCGAKPRRPSFAPNSINTQRGWCFFSRAGRRASPWVAVSPLMLAFTTLGAPGESCHLSASSDGQAFSRGMR